MWLKEQGEDNISNGRNKDVIVKLSSIINTFNVYLLDIWSEELWAGLFIVWF